MVYVLLYRHLRPLSIAIEEKLEEDKIVTPNGTIRRIHSSVFTLSAHARVALGL